MSRFTPVNTVKTGVGSPNRGSITPPTVTGTGTGNTISRTFGATQAFQWQPLDKYAIALYVFEGFNRFEIPLAIGDKIKIEEEIKGWYKGYVIPAVEGKPVKKGIFPATYVRAGDSIEAVESEYDVVMVRLHHALDQWLIKLQNAVQEQNFLRFNKVNPYIVLLSNLRQKLLNNPNPGEREQLRQQVNSTIAGGDAAWKEEIVKPKPPAPAPKPAASSFIKSPEEAKPVPSQPAQSPTPSRPVGNHQSPAAIKTLRPGMMNKTNIYLQMDYDQGMISFYQKHIEQRNKLSNQLKENTSPTPIAKSVSSTNLLGGLRSSGGSTGSPTPSRKQMTEALRDHTNSTSSRNLKFVSAAAEDKANEKKAQVHQIYIDMKVFMCSTGDPSELNFSLYNRDVKKFISEEFTLSVTAQGMPEDANRIGKLKAIFKDITDADLNSELYLVCRVVRKGKITLDSKSKKTTEIYRRPYGCGVLNICGRDEILGSSGVEKEHTLPIFCTSSENDIALLHEMIPKNENVFPAPHAKGIVVGLSQYKGEYEEVIRQHPELRPWPTINRLGFPDIILPGLLRNDFYLMLDSADLNKNENIEISVFSKLENGEDTPPPFVFGASDKAVSEFKSLVLNKEPNPRYKETVNMKLPTHLYEKTHLYFLIKTCSDSGVKEYAFAYCPLVTKEGTVIADGEHKLQIYTLPKNESDPTWYTKDPANNKTLLKNFRKGEELKIRTLLSSTQLTNDVSMLSLLNWKKVPPSQVAQILNRFTYVPTIEVLKFLKESFDAMFNILDQNNESVASLVFTALVFILGILLDEKRQSSVVNLRAVLDSYISDHFTGVSAHKHLMKCLKQDFEQLESKSQVSKIISTLKALEYIFKFMIASRVLYNKQNKASNEDVWFRQDVRAIFTGINELMKKTDAQFRGAQSNALKNFGSIISDLTKIFEPKELSDIVQNFIGSLQYSSTSKLLNTEKLHMLHKIIFSDLFYQRDSRDVIFPTILAQLEVHLKNSPEDEKILCVMILNDILHYIESKKKDTTGMIEHLIVHIPSIMKAAPSLKGQARLDIVTCLLTLLHLMSPDHYNILFKHMKQEGLWGFLVKLIVNFQSFILAPPYPDTWVAFNIYQYIITLKVAKEISNFSMKELNNSREQFFSDSTKDSSSVEAEDRKSRIEMWKQFFRLSVFFAQSKILNSGSKYSPEISDKCNELRIEMLNYLKIMWDALGAQKIKFSNVLIAPFVEIQATSGNSKIQEMAGNLYFNLLEVEYEDTKATNSTGSAFPKVESTTIETLDKMYSNTAASEEFKSFFFKHLEGKLKECNNPDFQKKGMKYMNDVLYFLELLRALKTLPEGPEYEDDRTVANMKLMEHFKATNRKEAYILHIHKLVEQHEKSSNYTEAGEALLLHSKLYKWSDEKLGEISGKFPAQTQRERKEQLCKQAIEYFDKGKVWERAIPLIKELREEYQFGIFDYDKLASLIETHSTLLKKIVVEARFFAEYYRVGYYGKGFDPSISGKEFIYRGLELERREEFMSRITSLFPHAQVLNYTDDPPSDIVNGPGQYLQITSVRPASMEEMEGKPSKIPESMPGNLQKYYQFNDVNVFVYSKPFRKSNVKSENEFKDLWLKNTYYVTEDTFPTIHRRSQIEKKEVLESHPIENAVKSIKEKNKELQETITRVANDLEQLQRFTMVLKGIIDAAVNGGTEKYKDAFFTPEFARENPNRKELVDELKRELIGQVSMLDEGILLHKKKCTTEMMGLQVLLEQKLDEMKEKSKSF